MYGTVYIIYCLVNDKYYVGQTVQPLRSRFRVHANHPTTYIAKAIRKYGRDNFLIEAICEAGDADELDRLEGLWIIALAAHVNGIGYNCMTTVGHISPEARARGDAKRRGIHRTEEHKEKVRIGLLRYFSTHVSPKKGRPMKESQREKLKALKGPLSSRWGKRDTEEVKEMRRHSLLGKHWKHRKVRRSGIDRKSTRLN